MMIPFEETFHLSLDNLLGGGVPGSTSQNMQDSDTISEFVSSAGGYSDLGRVSEDILPTPPPPID